MRKSRSFSSILINLPPDLSDEIIGWGEQNILDEEIFIDSDHMHYGREDEIHITVLYGLHDDCPEQSLKFLAGAKPFQITLGKIGVFTNKGAFDVVRIDVFSKELNDLNDILVKNLKFTNYYSFYHPHVTIAYVHKGKGWKHNRNPQFDGKSFYVNNIIFSSRKGIQMNFTLSADGTNTCHNKPDTPPPIQLEDRPQNPQH